VVQEAKDTVVIDLDDEQLRKADEVSETATLKKRMFGMPKGRKATMK
jgi:hypothetical protein